MALKPIDENNLPPEQQEHLALLRDMEWTESSLQREGSVGCFCKPQSVMRMSELTGADRPVYPIGAPGVSETLRQWSANGHLHALEPTPVKRALGAHPPSLYLSAEELNNLGITPQKEHEATVQPTGVSR